MRLDVSTLSASSEPEARRKRVADERAKLTTTYMNRLAIAALAVGGCAPFIALLGIAAEQRGFVTGARLLLGVCSLTSGTRL
ncbi:hypothetical protein [Methylobacterium sp. PvR107]|uniref:hypothetical protein n=1 Tax=Methylobacterium sp. PvR107 TaxID=2806597 RepID=UPI001AE97A5C|nr:hypothetical protein [Methylobacterium sp. PvR107]MBP1182063.1 hypothetical protein [Methylobacterium sp. PvR107]